MLKGIHLTLLVGPGVPIPAPKPLMDALESVEVTSAADTPSGFQLSFVIDNRSPLQHADSIRAPVIFFQGLDDVVVPPEQTERMAAALRANGIAVEVHLFPEEGHGFRNGATQIQVLEATEAFFRRHFQL